MVNGEVRIEAGTDAWQRALKRAAARSYQLIHYRTHDEGYGAVSHVYKVASASDPGTYRWVCLTQTRLGWSCQCDCPAGERDVPCVHAALALRAAGVLTAPAPVIFGTPDQAA
jgi:hypothetical protein